MHAVASLVHECLIALISYVPYSFDAGCAAADDVYGAGGAVPAVGLRNLPAAGPLGTPPLHHNDSCDARSNTVGGGWGKAHEGEKKRQKSERERERRRPRERSREDIRTTHRFINKKATPPPMASVPNIPPRKAPATAFEPAGRTHRIIVLVMPHGGCAPQQSHTHSFAQSPCAR
jgi:hypothetical protein